MAPAVKRALLYAWGGSAALSPLVYVSAALQPADLSRWLWLQLAVTAASFALAGRLIVRPTAGLAASMALLCLGLLSVLWAGDKGSALLQLLQWITCFQLLVLGTLMDADFRRATLHGLALAGGLAALIGILQNIEMPPPFYAQIYRPASTFVNRNQACEFVGALCPLALLLACTDPRPRLRLLYAALTGIDLVFVVLGRSRSTWLALALTSLLLLALIALHPRTRAAFHRCKHHLSMALLVLLLSVFIAFPGKNSADIATRQTLSDELGTIATGKKVEREVVNTLAVRLALYRNSLGMLADHPIGVGLGNFSRHYGAYNHRVMPTPTYKLTVEPERLHSDPYQILLELGPAGLLCFAFLLFQVAQVLRRTTDLEPETFMLESLGPFLVVATLLFNSCSSFPLKMPLTAGLFWLCSGFCLPAAAKGLKPQRAWGWLLLGFNLLLAALYSLGLYANCMRAQVPAAMREGKLSLALQLGAEAANLFPLDWCAADELLASAAALPNPSQNEVELARQFSERRPYSANAWFRRALIHHGLHQPQEALEAVNRAIALLGKDEEKLLQLRAQIHQSLGDQKAAAADRARAALLMADRP